MALTGTWYIYEQNIGSSAFTRTSSSVEIEARTDGEFVTKGNFPLTGEIVTFNGVTGQEYYLAETSLYRYRAQTLTRNGLKLLVGHVSTTPETGQPNPPRCVFAGLPEQKGSTLNPDEIELHQILHIPLFHDGASPHTNGEIYINRTAEIRTGLLVHQVEPNREFKISTDSWSNDGIRLEAKQAAPNIDELKATIIFDNGAHPIYIGYHWRSTGFSALEPKRPRPADPDVINSGQPTSQYCTRVTVGW